MMDNFSSICMTRTVHDQDYMTRTPYSDSGYGMSARAGMIPAPVRLLGEFPAS